MEWIGVYCRSDWSYGDSCKIDQVRVGTNSGKRGGQGGHNGCAMARAIAGDGASQFSHQEAGCFSDTSGDSASGSFIVPSYVA